MRRVTGELAELADKAVRDADRLLVNAKAALRRERVNAHPKEDDDGIVVDRDVQTGNPPDAPRIAPAITRLSNRAGRAPRTVTADRGYGERRVDDALHEYGVRKVIIPAGASPAQHGRPKSADARSAAPSSGEPDAEAESAT